MVLFLLDHTQQPKEIVIQVQSETKKKWSVDIRYTALPVISLRKGE